MKLELVSVYKTYNKQTEALSDLSFTVDESSFVSVIGASGSGKTTLLHILNGSLDADSGSVLVGGADILKLKGRKKRALQREIGMIYQDFCLVEQASCLDNVLNACLPDMNIVSGSLGIFNKAQRAEALQLLDRVGLAGKADEPVKALSGGQKQRVAIARALMQHPGLLLADEPVASLDPVTGRQILSLLRDIRDREQITVLMISHNPELSAEYSDRFLGLREGRLVYDGLPSDITPDILSSIYTGEEASAPDSTARQDLP